MSRLCDGPTGMASGEMMHAYDALWPLLQSQGLGDGSTALRALAAAAFEPSRNGHWSRWAPALEALPKVSPSAVDLGQTVPPEAESAAARERREVPPGAVTIGTASDLSSADQRQLHAGLEAFHPWRKGPWAVFGIHIDTEWRSDWKWARLAPHIDLTGHAVLDIGSGNGYYGCRAIGAGAAWVLGLDPFLPFTIQHLCVRHFVPSLPNWVLPVGVEALAPGLAAFDTVLSMGVLYHRRDPVAHLAECLAAARPGGQVVVESIVIDREGIDCLRPAGRYARMRNVHAIPSVRRLEQWLAEAGAEAVRTVDVSPTTPDEQHATAWMTFDSLPSCLDPSDPTRTVEGHPAPVRAVTLCRRAASR